MEFSYGLPEFYPQVLRWGGAQGGKLVQEPRVAKQRVCLSSLESFG